MSLANCLIYRFYNHCAFKRLFEPIAGLKMSLGSIMQTLVETRTFSEKELEQICFDFNLTYVLGNIVELKGCLFGSDY